MVGSVVQLAALARHLALRLNRGSQLEHLQLFCPERKHLTRLH